MKIIALSGKMGTGKTTLANLICSLVPCSQRVSFADTLREEVAEHFGFDLEFVRSTAFKFHSFRIGARTLTGRELLQWWGTEIRRKANPDYWIEKMALMLDSCDAPLIVVDDVRFFGEAFFIQEDGSSLYRLDPFPGWNPGPNSGHDSETALDNYPSFTARFSPEYGQLKSIASMIMGWEVS